MPRTSWNPNTPDVVGVEFQGVGHTSSLIQSTSQIKALRFKPQRTGEVDEIAIYSGSGTNNPVLSAPHFSGHRKPFIIELIPASGFDPGGVHTITTYQSAITSSAGVVDEVGTAPEGNELQAPNDGLVLFQSGSTPATATVHMLNANTFPLNQHVISVAIESGSFRAMNVRRIDQNGTFTWTKLLQGPVTWHMGEAYLESGDTTNWRLWSPNDIRQFNSGSGNRRLRYDALNTQSNTLDVLRIHVDSIPERRAGVAVIEPLGNYQWVTGALHLPNVTGSPAQVIAGQEYIVIVRSPNGDTDYGSTGLLDWRNLKDKRPSSSFQHYTYLDWDAYNVELWEEGVPRQLGDLADGLPCVRLINDGAQTVDSQPYSGNNSGVMPFKTDGATNKRPRQQFVVPVGSTEYAKARVLMSVFQTPTTPTDMKYVDMTLVNNAGTLIAGPFQITRAMVDAAPTVGTDTYLDNYKEVIVEFGSGIDFNEAAGVQAVFTLASDYGEPDKQGIGWRIGVAVAEVIPGTGDQTAPGAATGSAFYPPAGTFSGVHDTSVRRGDLLVTLLSQAPEITGASVEQLSQEVSGGTCGRCGMDHPVGCTVTEIPYHRVCWSRTGLTQEDFGYYEVQRREMALTGHMGSEASWETVAILAPTGSPVTGAPVTSVPTCWDDWSHVYDSEVCYRVRQQRIDGTFSDFVEEVCITTPSPDGGDIVITAPDDPTYNVAFPEAHSGNLPITHEWTNLDADSHVTRAVYGRDKHIAFRPIERLGYRFSRRLLISALCTPEVPCLSVTDGIHAVCQAPVGYLVVRDRCGNRFYATVNVPTITQLHDPTLDDIWLAEVEVTELATPIISEETVL